VNFWQPSERPPFVNAPVGLPFLFKLRAPHNHVAGGGYFVTFSQLPPTLAWEAFGPENGANSLPELLEMVSSHGKSSNLIGCTILANPFFFERSVWIPEPPNWSPNIVRGRMYDTNDPIDLGLWQGIEGRLTEPTSAVALERPKYGDPVLVKPRLGQGSFRILVTDAYRRRCAITGENTLVALEAAHIEPYSGEGNHEPSNGLLLRADFHRLFDVGLVGVTPELKVKISPRIRETYFNGKAYYRLDGQPLAVVPDNPALRPDRDRLHWHMQNRFQH